MTFFHDSEQNLLALAERQTAAGLEARRRTGGGDVTNIASAYASRPGRAPATSRPARTRVQRFPPSSNAPSAAVEHDRSGAASVTAHCAALLVAFDRESDRVGPSRSVTSITR